MSSAANDKRGKLEEEFSNRMYDAEASPSQDLWARIDHELTVQENGEYKKRAAFYRQLAAACITLLLLAGGVGAWYFSGPAAIEQPLATVAPATNPGPATALPAPSEDALGTVAATAKAEKDENATPALEGTGVSPVKLKPATRATMATASGAALRSRASSAETAVAASPEPATENSEVTEVTTGTLAVAGTETPEAGEREQPLSLSKSLRQTIAALSATEQKAGSPELSQQSFAATGPGTKATDDFRKLNEQVMAHAKRVEEEQKARLLAFNEETTEKKDSRKEKGEGNSRWSLGMAYAPGYFEQNIGLPEQMMGAANRLAMDPEMTRVSSSINNSYIQEAREEYAENTDPGFSFGFEMKTGLKLGKKLKLLAGLGFLQNTARSRSSYLVQQFGVNAYSGRYDNSGPSSIFVPSISSDFATSALYVVKIPEYSVNHRYRYLTVPVELQYHGNISNDWFWYGGAGVAANMLVQTTILASASEVKDVEYNLNEESPFRRLQWSGRMSGGVGKRLAGNMSVTLGPEVRGYFDTLLAEPENSPAPQGRPYALGLNMAVNYDLNTGKKSR